MFSHYIEILSNCSKTTLKDMANIDISDVTIKQVKSLSATYSIAHSIHYEDSKKNVKGEFILGFADDSKALPIATAIAENIGLSAVEKFDEIVSDVINEFLNTVAGNFATKCCKNGLYDHMSPAIVSQNKKIDISDMSKTIVYLMSFDFAPGTIKAECKAENLSLIVTFTKTGDDNLAG
jgi:CheY-specific phosphatase CheX